MALGTAAHAQVTNVTGMSGTTVQLDSTFSPGHGTVTTGPGLVSQGGGAAYFSSYSSGSEITFESANASIRGSNQVSSTSSTSVDITIQNNGTAAVDPLLKSTITGAGLGVYLANTAGACGGSGVFAGGDPFGGCGQTTGGQTFNTQSGNGPLNQTAALAEFDFNVTAGGKTVYDFSGVEDVLQGDGSFLIVPRLLSATLNGVAVDPSTVLSGFTHITPGNNGAADGYAWNDTAINVDLQTLLGVGSSMHVVYTATVHTLSLVNCDSSSPSVCTVPYAAFGDPIGRGGGTNLAPLFGPKLDISPLADVGTGGINFVDDWKLQKFNLPTFANGVLTFNAVPEPQTWMTMILGFGVIGAALRRRRVLSYT